MRILWNRVAALVLAIALILLAIILHKPMASFLATIRALPQPYATPEERTTGLMAFGLVVLLVLGIVRLLSSPNDRNS